MKKLLLVIFGFVLSGSLAGCVGPAYRSDVYGGPYYPYYSQDSVYLYEYPYPGYYGSFYSSHSFFRHSGITHKRPSAKFDHHRRFGKDYPDRYSRHNHFVGSHDHRSNRYLQRGHEGRIVKDDKPSLRRGSGPDDSRRAITDAQRRGDRRVNREFGDRAGWQSERAVRQNGKWRDPGRSSVKCFGQRC